MKTLVLTLAALLSHSAVASANLDNVQCGGVLLDLEKDGDSRPLTVQLVKEDQPFHVVFEGKIEKNSYRVVIEKSSQTVNGYIDRADGEMLSFRGAFNNGIVEFGAHQGVMIPVKMIAISCIENL